MWENDIAKTLLKMSKARGETEDPFHKKLTDLTGVEYSRIREIEMDILYMIKVDPEIKDVIILFDRIFDKYKDENEKLIAVYAAGLVIGVDKGRKKSGMLNSLMGEE